MFHRVACENCVVGLDVELEMVQQFILAEKVQAGRRVRVVLVLGRLLRFRLDVELALEAEFLLPRHRHVEEPAQVVQLALHVGVDQAAVALAATPEGVALAPQAVSHLDGLFHLGSGVGVDLGVGRGRRPHGVALMGEEAGSAPKQFLARLVLQALQLVGHCVKGRVGLGQGAQLGCYVTVVEAIKVNPHLVEELEEHVGPLGRVLDRVAPVVPRCLGGAHPEGIAQRVAHAVPVGGPEAHVVAHRLALHFLIGVVVLEGQRVL